MAVSISPSYPLMTVAGDIVISGDTILTTTPSTSGILLIDKPSGLSSAGVLRQLQKQLRYKKLGHAGTLDPMATGLLVVLTGNATRCAQYAEDGEKEYEAQFLWGKETSTDDVEGEVVHVSEERPCIEAIRAQLAQFIGTIDQVPPNISSIKIDGERAYTRARRGELFEIPARKVSIRSIEELGHDRDTFSCRIRCGPGTYIRSIARDLGRQLGTYGTLQKLRRTCSFPYAVRDAHPLEAASFTQLLPIESLFSHSVTVILEDDEAKSIQQGKSVMLATLSTRYPSEQLLLYRRQASEILGILVRPVPEKNFIIGCNFPLPEV